MPRVAVVGHVEFVEFLEIERLPVEGEVLHATGAFTRAAGGGGVAAVVLAGLGAEVHFFHGAGSRPRRRSGRRRADRARRADARRLAQRADPPGGNAPQGRWRADDRHDRRATQSPRQRPAQVGAVARRRRRLLHGGGHGALQRSREARELVATPRARDALEGDGPIVDALVFARHDQEESDLAKRFARRARLFVSTDGADGGNWSGDSEGTWPRFRRRALRATATAAAIRSQPGSRSGWHRPDRSRRRRRSGRVAAPRRWPSSGRRQSALVHCAAGRAARSGYPRDRLEKAALAGERVVPDHGRPRRREALGERIEVPGGDAQRRVCLGAGAKGSATPTWSCWEPTPNHTPPRERNGSGFSISTQPQELAEVPARLGLAPGGAASWTWSSETTARW